MSEAMSRVYLQLVPVVVRALGVQPLQRRVSESIHPLTEVETPTQSTESLSTVESQVKPTETHRNGTKRKQHNNEHAYPTEAREREKAKKKKDMSQRKNKK